jgi:TolA-binding protein
MFVVLLVIFILSLLGLIGCLALRGPLIHAAEERQGLSSARASITDARRLRMAEHSLSTDFEEKVKAQRKMLAELEGNLKTAQQQVALLPKQTFEIIFELGTPEKGMQAYEFVVARNRRGGPPSDLQGAEAELWARPRILRAWSRNQTGAMAMAQSRFPSMDGFMLRVVERLDKAVLPSVTMN